MDSSGTASSFQPPTLNIQTSHNNLLSPRQSKPLQKIQLSAGATSRGLIPVSLKESNKVLIYNSLQQNNSTVVSNINNAKQTSPMPTTRKPHIMPSIHQSLKSIPTHMETAAVSRINSVQRELALHAGSTQNSLDEISMKLRSSMQDLTPEVNDPREQHATHFGFPKVEGEHLRELRSMYGRNRSNLLNKFNNQRIQKYNKAIDSANKQMRSKRNTVNSLSLFSRPAGLANSARKAGANPIEQEVHQTLASLHTKTIDGRLEEEQDSLFEQPKGSLLPSSSQALQHDGSSTSQKMNIQANEASGSVKILKPMPANFDADSEVSSIHGNQQLESGREKLKGKAKEFSLEKQIIEEGRLTGKSTYGLPTIGGAITGQKLKKAKYYNPHLANNGRQLQVSQFSTTEDFKLSRQRQTLKFDWVHEKVKKQQALQKIEVGSDEGDTLKALQTSSLEPPSPYPKDFVKLDHSNDVDKYLSKALSKNLALPNLKDVETHLTAKALTQRSNAKFNQTFRVRNTFFKSPVQHKNGVLISATKLSGGLKLPTSLRSSLKPEFTTLKGAKHQPFEADMLSNINDSEDGAHTSKMVSHNNSPSFKGNLLGIARQGDGSERSLIRGGGMKSSKNVTILSSLRDTMVKVNNSFNMSNSPISDVEEEEEATGLKLSNYLIQKDISQLLTLLEEIGTARKEHNIIDDTIREIAKENGIRNLTDFKKDVTRFFDRRAVADAMLQTKFSDLQEQSKCEVTKKSLEFLNYLREDKEVKLDTSFQESPSPDRQGMTTTQQQFNKTATTDLNKTMQAPKAFCNHTESEEDVQMRYLTEYKRYLKFVRCLRERLSNDIPKSTLIQSLIVDINSSSSFTEQEKRLFQSEEAVKSLLQNPMLEIAHSIKEIAAIQEKKQQAVQQSISQTKTIIGSSGPLLMRRSTNIMIKQVSNQVLKDSLTIHAIKNKYSNRNVIVRLDDEEGTRSRHESFIDLSQLLFETKRAARAQQQEEKPKVDIKKRALDELQMYRVQEIKRFKRNRVLFSLSHCREEIFGPRKDFETLSEEEFHEFKYLLTVVDEVTSENMQKFVEKATELHKQHLIELQDSMMHFQRDDDSDSSDQATEDSEVDQNVILASLKRTRRGNIMRAPANAREELLNEKRKQIFKDMEAREQFYQQAKQEIQGFNRQTNTDSIFYHECNTNTLLPKPLFTCINENTLLYQGKIMSLGYAKALAKFIKAETSFENQIMKIHLDDCSMKDPEFAVLLDSVLAQKGGLSMQSLIYSNNEMGEQSIKRICQLVELSHRHQGRTLKCLCFSNVVIRNVKHLRILSECISFSGDYLQKLKFQAMNVNDRGFIEHMATFLKDSKKLVNFELSGCHLQAAQLCELTEVLDGNQLLERLDFSNNGMSELKQANLEKEDVLLKNLELFVSQSRAIHTLNLEGLFLGKKILSFVKVLKESKSLIQVNLANNLLTPRDEECILSQLEVKPEVFRQDLLEEFDMCFGHQIAKFRTEHMLEDNKLSENTSTSDVINQIINSGITKQLRSNRNLQKKLNINSKIGQVIANTGSKSIGLTHAERDSLVLRRNIGFNELVYNELHKDSFEFFDFARANRWHLQPDSSEISESQYVMIYFDIESIREDFELITDHHTLEVFRNLYQLDVYKKVRPDFPTYATEEDEITEDESEGCSIVEPEVFKCPIVFGTLTDWKPISMMKLHEFASCLVSVSDKERNQLLRYVFDAANDLKFFKNITMNALSAFRALASLYNAHVIGSAPDEYARSPLIPGQEPSFTYVHSGFVSPGKHSIFIYYPRTNQMFKKIIAVDSPDLFRSRVVHFKQYPSDLSLDSFAKLKKQPKFLSNFEPTRRELTAFLNDTKHSIFDLSSITSKVDVEHLPTALGALRDNFFAIHLVYSKVQQKCPHVFPFITKAALHQYCLDKNLGEPEELEQQLGELPPSQPVRRRPGQKVEPVNDMTRSEFLAFLLWLAKSQGQPLNKMGSFLTTYIIPLAGLDDHKKIEDLFSGQTKLISEFEEAATIYLDEVSHFYGLTPEFAKDLLATQMNWPVPSSVARRLYIRSKELPLVLSRSHDKREATDLTNHEFLLFLFRTALYLFNPNNFAELPEDAGVNKPLLKTVPDDIQHLFEAPLKEKYQFILEAVLAKYKREEPS